MSTMPLWTQAEVDTILALAAQGLGASEIARRIGTRTKHAVAVKLSLLGMRPGGLARSYTVDAGVHVRPWGTLALHEQCSMKRWLGLTE